LQDEAQLRRGHWAAIDPPSLSRFEQTPYECFGHIRLALLKETKDG
jgi:hypothetical protein